MVAAYRKVLNAQEASPQQPSETRMHGVANETGPVDNVGGEWRPSERALNAHQAPDHARQVCVLSLGPSYESG